MQDVSAKMTDIFKADYANPVEDRAGITGNAVRLDADRISPLLWISYGRIFSKVEQRLKAEYEDGNINSRTLVERDETMKTSLASSFRKMIFAGYLQRRKRVRRQRELRSADANSYSATHTHAYHAAASHL